MNHKRYRYQLSHKYDKFSIVYTIATYITGAERALTQLDNKGN